MKCHLIGQFPIYSDRIADTPGKDDAKPPKDSREHLTQSFAFKPTHKISRDNLTRANYEFEHNNKGLRT